jgi:hypothetical protein
MNGNEDMKVWWKNTHQQCEVEKGLKLHVWGLHGEHGR